jgi:hypothetical protein
LSTVAIRLTTTAAKELHRVVEFGTLDVADEEPEIERAREDDEKAEDDLL